MRARALSLIAFAIAACSREPRSVRLDLPPFDDTAKSWLIAVEGDSTELYGFSPRGQGGPAIVLDPIEGAGSAELTVEAVGVGEDPAALGISADGKLTPPRSGTKTRSVAMLPTRSVASAKIHGANASAWIPQGAPSLALGLIEVFDPHPPRTCPTYTPRSTVTLTDAASTVIFGVPIDSETALVGTPLGALYAASRAGSVTSIALNAPSTPAHYPMTHAISSGRSGEWLISAGKTIFRGTIGASTAAIDLVPLLSSRTASASRRTWLAPATRDPIPQQLYWLFYAGTLERIDLISGSETHLYDFPERQGDSNGALVFSGGDAYAALDNLNAVVRVSGGAVTEEHPTMSADSYSGALDVPGLGMVVCSARGTLLVREPDGSWRSLGASGLALGVCELAPYKDGFMFAGDQGFFGTYTSATGLCMGTPVAAATLTAVFAIGDVPVVAGYLGGTEHPTLTWLEER